MSRISLAILAGLAICTTAGAAACLAMISLDLSPFPAIRAAAIAAATLQGTLLILLSWLISAHIMVNVRQISRPYTGIAVGFGVLASLASLAAAALALTWMETSTNYNDHVYSNRSKIIAVSVMLALAVTSQILFMSVQFAHLRYGKFGARHLFASREASPWSPATHVKSIRYSQTLPRKSDSEESESFGLKETPPSLRNKFVQASPLNLAFPQAVRQTPSRTRLLHAKDSAQSLAMDTATHPNATQESFDTWDTSSVDAQNRQAVMEVCTSPITSPYNLEPIPGSPRGSINPEDMVFFAPPRPILKRSRSHSPATGRLPLRGRAPANPDELHIHPLFRSDSPSTPPILTPGTRVVAAPAAGKILFHRASSRSLPRVRSGSLPAMSRSPFAHDLDSDNLEEEVHSKQDAREQERKMTPPVPEWVLNSKVPPPIPYKSASRSSLRVSTTSSLRVSTTSSLRVSSA